MNEAAYKELKKGGMMRQAEAGLFSVRLHVVGGRLGAPQLQAIREAADRFGRGEAHLTSRQGVEIPFVRQDALAALKELEFDHRSGKIDDVDYRALVGPLRRAAAEALQALDADKAQE